MIGEHTSDETDDDREWIPGPNQTGVIPHLPVTDDIRTGWLAFLDEMEAILAGKTLVPHWRVKDGRGINVRRVFTQPPERFDVVLWVTGADVLAYLEKGTVSKPATWERINRLFGGQFGLFAEWFD